ncbi:hypothetical protein DL93DRAFT_2075571 [Clavulina sp. PMI_390]|nr:hypothetical protein DL93DRAFT_2075571 [Clavulina sp. PMI_390]
MSSSLDSTTLSLILTEILGSAPQILLDDYTNIPHDNVRQTTEAFEGVLRDWIERDIPEGARREAYLAELERGIIAIQTRIGSHSDFAFDLFEVWVWRNIFDIPANVAPYIVMPHHEDLDLTISDKEEEETRSELALLRRRLEAMKRIGELLVDGVKASRRRRRRADRMLQELSFLQATDELQPLPPAIMPLFEKLKEVPRTSDLASMPAPSASDEKRPWEASHDQFLAWSTAKLVRETRKPGERGKKLLIGQDEQANAEYLRQLDDAAGEEGRSDEKRDGKGKGKAILLDTDGDTLMS